MLGADQVKNLVEGIINQSDVGATHKLDRVCQVLKKQKLMSEAVVTPQQMFIHPQNRGGSMVGCHDAHLKGQRLLHTGVRVQLLEAHSFCIEMASDDSERQLQISRNEALSRASEGLLASPTGEERFLSLSLGASHSYAFVKYLSQGCVSPSGDKLSSDVDETIHRCQHGWKWQVFTAQCEKLLPNFPNFVSIALNSSNSNSIGGTEVEAASQIVQMYNSGMQLEDAISFAKAGEPKCKEYVEQVGLFVSKFGGGKQFPLVSFLHAFSTSHRLQRFSDRVSLLQGGKFGLLLD